ncbi:cGMP-dependent 3',5'-cyclic phosphodiesterase isoform X1 [Patella vulgata]|uniref:cGMP-dependent 3',5'-cyclic phosphodiesterase isoform X1 n=1 Tax=Patella vulgata TaxID=6465 RepID=UPI00218031BD|nr:cGMP-dependent 3',5'-cyclic phosphodiesterase isoform X1 [Patella vulgata]
MVIVLAHTIASAYLYIRNPDSFGLHRTDTRVESGDSPSTCSSCCKQSHYSSGISENFYNEEAYLPLLEAKTIPELRLAIRNAISSIVSQLDHVVVYLKNPTTGIVEADGGKTIPSDGLLWHVFHQENVSVTECPSTLLDPLSDCLGLSDEEQENHSVICIPVPGKSEEGSIGIIAASFENGISVNVHDSRFEYLKKQTSVCYQLIKSSTNIRRKSVCESDSHIESLIGLCGELYDQDAASLQIKVIKYLQQRTQAQSAFLLLVVPDTQELFCQVVGSKVLQEEFRFPGQTSCFAPALERKKPINLDDLPKDKRQELHDIAGTNINSFLCVPVRRKGGEDLIALACVLNKKGADRFCGDDAQAIRKCFQYTATVLTSTLAFQNERKLKNQTQALLHVARKLFTRLDDLTKLLREIMQEARNLTQAERCSVFLIDEDELVAKVFDGISAGEQQIEQEIILPKTQGIAGHVATSGQLLNIKDAYSHPLFYRGIDDSTGFRTRNILCFPIKNEDEMVLGVAQLCNKKTGPCFTQFDEDIASAFAVYCCISISHSLMYQKMIDAQSRNSLINELMMYHMKVTDEEVTYLDVDIKSVYDIHPDFDQFSYAPRTLAEEETPGACMSMFEDLGFISKWRIKKDCLIRFVLMVKRGYRNPPYHNWMHAYSVAHFCYLLIKNLKLEEIVGDIQVFALFVSCLCHDIDHRGTTNSFQVESQSVLAALYSSEGSVMERHHFAQSMCILNTEGCNIFENLSSMHYTQVLDLMREIILATDLAHHLRILKSLKEIANNGYNTESSRDVKLLLCLSMTSCDLSDQTKNWKNTKHIASLVYQEFFSQGDLEKALGQNPLEMMDRDRACIPDLQISFLDNIALPVYEVLAKTFPRLQEVLQNVLENRSRWEKIGQVLKLRRGNSSQQLTVEQIIALDSDSEEFEALKQANAVNGR